MASPLLLVRDQIVTDLEALSPPDDSAMPYRWFRATDGHSFGDGLGFHRMFRFRWFESNNQHDFGPGLAIEEHRLELRIRENSADRVDADEFDCHVNEAELVKRAINERQGWPTGVDYVHCARARAEKLPPPSSNWDLVFEIVARTEES